MPLRGLNARTRRILVSVIAEYIATGDPVGSRTLSRKYGLDLSPATIRNVLADLEEAGYLHQPHTSAGRVPTEKALRAFIDALTEFEEITRADKQAMRARFEEIFSASRRADPSERMRLVGQVVSDLAGVAAVVAGAPTDTRQLTQLRFIPTRPGQMLAVLVFSSGAVENRSLEVGGEAGDPPAEHELERIHNLLADVVEGRSLGDLRELFVRRLESGRSEIDALKRKAFQLGRDALRDVPRKGDVVIAGSTRLLDRPEYDDADKLKRLLMALEERENLVSLLDKTIEAGSVTVYIGSEVADVEGAELSLIVAPYGDSERGSGTVGVLGPTRMDYARIVPLVDATAAAMTAALKKID
ncbi:MAG: heat-inducible transcriptional repressor HrcA [Myxococcota bacterium]